MADLRSPSRSGFRSAADAVRYLQSLKCLGPRELLGGTRQVVLAIFRQYHPSSEPLELFPTSSRFRVETLPVLGNLVIVLDTEAARYPLRLSRLLSETPHQRLALACRRAVDVQTRAARDAYWAHSPQVSTCPVLGIPMTPDTCDVDHAPPWTHAALVERFSLEQHRLPESPESRRMFRQAAERDAPEFDPRVPTAAALAAEWIELHARHARLRIVSQLANRVVLPRDSATLA